MKTTMFILTLFMLTGFFAACHEEKSEMPDALDHLKSTRYFEAEIFSEQDLKIYDTWKLFDVSGGFHGGGHDNNFDYLVFKNVGIYGFVRNDNLLEYGKVFPVDTLSTGQQFFVIFEKDENSGFFFSDNEKYVHFSGNDTLHLYSPCCDRFNYHLERVK